MNWKQVKSIKIKEGDVKSLSINSQVVWSKGEVPPEPPAVILPYSENFDKIEPNTIPKGWDFITNDRSDGGIYVVGYESYSKPNCIKTDPSATQDCYAILPDFGVDIKKLTLSFWNKVEGESSYLMEVGYMDGGIAAENYVKIVDVARGEFRKYEQKSFKFKDLTIPGSGKGRLAIRYKSHGHTGWYTWLDNVEVDKVRARPNAFRFYNPGDQVNTLSVKGSPVFETSLDGVEWNAEATFTSMDIQPKGTLYLRGRNDSMDGKTFSSTQPIECHGSVMDLVDGGTDTTENTRRWLFEFMFKDMNTLLTAPKLPATKVGPAAYYQMFQNCTSLTATAEISITEGESICCKGMYDGCSSLTKITNFPRLITISDSVFEKAFRNCTALEVAEIIFTGNTSNYLEMFLGCSNLKYIKVEAKRRNESSLIIGQNWVSGVSPTGTFVKDKVLNLKVGLDGIPEGWIVEEFVPIPAQEPVTDKSFRFENKSAEPRTVGYIGKPGDVNYDNTKFIVSKDGKNWEWWNKVEEGYKPFETKTINAGEKLYIRGVGNKSLGTPPADSAKNGFDIPNQLEVHGDIHDLATGGVNGFSKLFYSCHITTIPEGIYYNFSAQEGEFFAMLSNTDITKVSDNNSITIGSVDAKYSLWSLFQDCKQLTDISVKVDALCGDNTIGYMFHGCSNAHMNVRISYYTWNQNCANDWLYGTAGGNIYTSLTIDAYGGWDRIPDNWTFNGKPKPKTFNVPYSMNFDSVTDENGQEVFPDVDLVYGNKNNLSNPSVMVWPDSWDVIGNGTSTSEGVVYVDRPSRTSWPLSNNCLYSVSAPDKTIYVVLPKFNLTVNLLKLKYWLRCEQVGSSFDVTVGHMTNINNPDTFVENTNYDNTTSEGNGMWHEINWSGYSVDEADRITFRFSNAGANNFYTWLDNITVTQV